MSFPPAAAEALPAFGPWRDPRRRCRWAVGALAVAVWATLVELGWEVVGIAAAGGLVEPWRAGFVERYDAPAGPLAVASLASLAAAAATFIAWQRAVVANTAFLGCERPEPGPGLAAVYWFVPFANLVLPFMSLLQVERWSRPRGAGDATVLLSAWWAAWVGGGMVGVVSVVVEAVGGGEAWVAARATAAVSVLLQVAAGVLAIRTVRVITGRQLRRAEQRAGEPAFAATGESLPPPGPEAGSGSGPPS